jgi:FkbM family methyltransferase
MLVRRVMRRLLPRALSLRVRREWLSRQVSAGRGYFEDDIPLLRRYVRPADVCWDIGANTGTYTLHLSRQAARVIAFEPMPHNFEILKDVISRARLDNVAAHQLALADRVGRARMHVPTNGFYGGYYLARLDEKGEAHVRTSTIDALVAEGAPEPDFIKCDVEGAERLVLMGARGLLARRRPIWLLETFEDGIVELVRSFGYTAYTRNHEKRLIEVTTRVPERNYWFFPDDAEGGPMDLSAP